MDHDPIVQSYAVHLDGRIRNLLQETHGAVGPAVGPAGPATGPAARPAAEPESGCSAVLVFFMVLFAVIMIMCISCVAWCAISQMFTEPDNKRTTRRAIRM
jgi:hypothetical protein